MNAAPSVFERIALIAARHPHPLARQRANGVLRRRYGIERRPVPQRDPVWLRAHD